MPEYYKKVVCVQFTLTPDEKELIATGTTVYFDGHPVIQSGGGRYHILFPMGDRQVPLHESDWIVRNPEIEIKRDHDFRAQYIAYDSIDPIAVNEKLERLMQQRNQK